MATVIVNALISKNGFLPTKGTNQAACYDLYAAEDACLGPTYEPVSTGAVFAIPRGYEGLIRPRSGLALKKNVIVHPGTIDSDYRGVVMVLMAQLFDPLADPTTGYNVRRGERIAQLAIRPIPIVIIQEGPIDPNTDRGEGGFGSTGK